MGQIHDVYLVFKDMAKEFSNRRRELFPLPWVHSRPNPSVELLDISEIKKTQAFLLGVGPGVNSVSYLVLTSIGEKRHALRYIDLVTKGRKLVYVEGKEWLNYISSVGFPVAFPSDLAFGGDVKKLVKFGKKTASRLHLKIRQGNFIILPDDKEQSEE